MLDINILPIYYRSGQEESDSGEVYAVMPPKRPARGRENDSLILYLNMAGNAPLTVEQQGPLMERLAQKFYKATGSVTAAMRSVAEVLNLHLLDRNLRISGAGKQGVGLFIIIVLRGDTLYLAHCGPVHSFLVNPRETQVMHDAQGAGRGLGLSKTAPMRFFQVTMQSGDYLVLSPHSPAGWTTGGLRYTPRLGIEGMRRHLLDQAGAELSSGTVRSVLLHAQGGEGKLRMLRRKAGTPDMARTIPQPESPSPSVEQPALSPQPSPVIQPPAEATSRPDVVSSIPQVVPLKQPALSTESVTQTTVVSSSGLRRIGPRSLEGDASSAKPKNKAPKAGMPDLRQVLQPMQAGMGAVGRVVGNTLESAGQSLGRLVRNILPDESLLHLPPSMMVFIAVAIPLVIATVGGAVYVQRGKASQHQTYYEQALVAAKNASGQTEAPAQRAAWLLVLGALDSAEFYKSTPESKDLRNQAMLALDTLDKIERLVFQPALTEGMLGAEFKVKRMIVNGNDLYLLNADQGNVLRAYMTGRGYEVDPTFKCGPSQGPLVVGQLVDIIALTPGLFEDAAIVGIDAAGNLLYCSPDGEQAVAVQLALPGNFVEAVNLEIDNGDLYVLDPQSKAVWLYNNMKLDQLPRDFFGEDRPDNLADVIDMAINNDDLFLLHADGQISKCAYSSLPESPTRCDDPFLYQDARAGRVSGPLMEEALFNQIYFSPPPGPSIYMLDPQQQAIYYFSKRLAMQSQYRPVIGTLPDLPASAFAVSAQRLAYLAIGNQIYYTALP
jgi:hypothetical protein